MFKKALRFILSMLLSFFITTQLLAQEPVDSLDKNDTFFLAKKKGLLGKLGRSISLEPPGPEPVKTVNPYLILPVKQYVLSNWFHLVLEEIFMIPLLPGIPWVSGESTGSCASSWVVIKKR